MFKNKWFRYTFFILFTLFSILFIYNIYSSIRFSTSLSKSSINKFQGEGIYNPYSQSQQIWKKIALHIHSNSIFIHKDRYSPEEIFSLYSKRGYDFISISDYNSITDISHLQGSNLPSFEWGSNFIKRHFLLVGSEHIIPDYFPLFARLENIQWSINELEKGNPFLIINHPRYHKAFTSNDLVTLKGFNAIEIVSPFDNSIPVWDDILSNGKPIFFTVTDDMHHLPPHEVEKYFPVQPQSRKILQRLQYIAWRQVFRRYLLLDLEKTTPESIKAALCSGNYIGVSKEDQNDPDPEIKKVGLINGNLVFSFLQGEGNIRFIGEGGKILASQHAKKAELPFPTNQSYVRIEATIGRNTVYSNPFFRNSHLEKKSCGFKDLL